MIVGWYGSGSGDVVCLCVGASAGCMSSSVNDLVCSCFVIVWCVSVVTNYVD